MPACSKELSGVKLQNGTDPCSIHGMRIFFVFASLRIHEVEEEERKLFFFAFVSNRRIPLLSFLFYKGRQLAATL